MTEAELDERKLPSLTEGLVVRQGSARFSSLAAMPAPGDSLLAQKGEAAPSRLAALWAEESSQVHPNLAVDGDATELRALRDELALIKAKLADREAALSQAEAAIREAQANAQQEVQNALSEAGQRLAAAEEKWRQQAETTLAELTIRCEHAEKSLGEANSKTDAVAAREQASTIEHRRLREELAAMRTTLANRGGELQRAARPVTKRPRELQQREAGGAIVLKPRRAGGGGTFESETEYDQQDAKPKRNFVRDIVVVALFGAAIFVLYPMLGLGGGAPSSGSSIVAVGPVVVVTEGVNVRAGPSTEAAIVSKVQPGTKLTTIEQSGDWTRVRISESDNAAPIEGWVYSSYLKADASSPAP